MPRSSGQKPRPQRAIAFDESLISSRPSNCTEPLRWPTMPMMDFSVVVLPAPLRPSSVTTSPGRTSKVTPCSTCDSPYQASSASTVSSGVVVTSSMARPQIGFAHLGVGGDGLVVAFDQHATSRQHGDAVGQLGDHAEIVFDHQHGAALCDSFDEGRDA